MPKLSKQTAVLMMSTMESTAPTSCKCTCSMGRPWALGLCLCHNAEHLPGQLFCSVRGLHPVDDGVYIRNVAMHMSVHVIVMMVVTVLVRMLMLVGMLMLMTVSILVMVMIMVAVAVLMTMVVIVGMIVSVAIVMMVLMLVVMFSVIVYIRTLIQNYIKVAGVDAALERSADLDLISIHMEACQRILQHFSVCAKIQKGRHRHISADTGITL